MDWLHLKCLYTALRREKLRLVIAIMVFSFAASLQGAALEGTSTLSGRVVDLEGNPVAGFGLSLLPFSLESAEGTFITLSESHSDEMGRFSMSNIPPAKVRLTPATKFYHSSGTSGEIVSVKVAALTVYRHENSPWQGIAFAIKPDVHVENVDVRVKLRNYIRGRIVFLNGTPLSSARINVSVNHRTPDGTGSGSSSSSNETDADGYFKYYVDESAIYTMTVNYHRLSASADPFLLGQGEDREDLVFTLDRLPNWPEGPTGRVEVSAEVSTSPRGVGAAWVVNPANGHAYKRIRSESWNEANTHAAAEDGYLVAINDAAEQDWISKTFGPNRCWIGLTDYANEGEWVWANGEPVTFTNWAPHEPHDKDTGEEDFVSMGLSGEWFDVGPASIEWRLPHIAIIEKDSTPGKTTRTK
ncbi:MAG: lectin-like protein [Candidatus Poribacteria bacterium]|nr:lectin-like protein [Candidatus Poribacteria bacterium]